MSNPIDKRHPAFEEEVVGKDKVSHEVKQKIYDEKRRRWANVAAIYVFMLFISIVFMGPFVFGVISSFKDNANEYPPRLTAEQLKVKNWIGAFSLASQAGGNGWVGEFQPGHTITMEMTYLYPAGSQVNPPEGTVPRRMPGSGRQALRLDQEFAADFVAVNDAVELDRTTVNEGVQVTWAITVQNNSDLAFRHVPFDVLIDADVEFVDATLHPNRVERLGRVQSWNNIAAGVFPYIFKNYNRVFSENVSRRTGIPLFLSWIFNSLFLSVSRMVTTVLFASMAGFALAKFKFTGARAVFYLMLFSMMVPPQVIFISNYLVLRDGIFGITQIFGVDSLLNTFTGLIISGLVNAPAVFIMKQFFEGLPDSMMEAARIDGAGTFKIFSSIMLPMAKPALGAVSILTFQGVWNEFFWPLVVITSPESKFPLTVGLLNLRQMYGAGAMDWGLILAGAIISALPIVILFFIFQKYFVEGASFSGIK
ncbi:MAG: carbohydrate ABC transporter permease [Spirochaetia bacterium]